ncbi:MAG: hypothetical protein GY719_07360 [bacterium]|nr:hypothetical protein [bacterium]
MADIIVEVGLQGNNITLSKNPIVARKGKKPEILWTAENEAKITQILDIHIKSPWPPGQQPTPVTAKVWSVLNPNGFKHTYKYDISVKTKSNKTIVWDPEIENQGQNGGGEGDGKEGKKD